ncbi:MAG: 3'(2'),5'-bisphosphate nucleotidase CysQ [Candidatus Bathyarchaeia archaeon]
MIKKLLQFFKNTPHDALKVHLILCNLSDTIFYKGVKMMVEEFFSVLCEVVQKAGEAVLQIADNGFSTAYKANQDPVTVADLEANRILREKLLRRFPDFGWLSEETQDNMERLKKKWVWVVDPIDGTKEFIDGIPEFTISVALVREGHPLIAAIYNPTTKELFTAMRGKGAWLNGNRIQANHILKDRPIILASRSEVKRGEFQPFEAYAIVKPVGSIAYKLSLVAAGRADATFSLGPKNEWDIAAGVLLVEEAGGRVTDKEGNPFKFNQPNTLVNGIIAATQDTYHLIRSMIEKVPRKED